MLRRLVATLVVATALLAGSASIASAAPALPDFGAQARASGLTAAQAENLQQRVDGVLSTIAGGRQVSATEVRYDGLIVTVDPRWDGNARTTTRADFSCDYGWFCIVVRGTQFNFYECKMWSLTNWTGIAPYINNQSPGTIFRAFGQDPTDEVWADDAPEDGWVDVSPWWHLKPC